MSSLLTIETKPIEWWAELIDKGKPFSKTRWGDSEWRSVLLHGTPIERAERFIELGKLIGHWGHHQRVDCGGNQSHFHKDLCREMYNILQARPEYMLATARRFGDPDTASHWHGLAKMIKAWVHANGLDELVWYNMDTLPYALADGTLGPFVEAIRGRKHVMLVGPPHLVKLELFKFEHFVPVPRYDAYTERDKVMTLIYRHLDKATEHVLVLFSAGMLTEPLVHHFHHRYKKHSFVDVGSIWDPFVGEMSRNYMKKLDPKVLEI